MTKMSDSFDITRKIISSEFIQNNIYSLFPDSLFLDKDFNILGLSENIYRHLGFQAEELRGKSVSILENSGHLADALRVRLQNGYFNDEIISMRKQDGSTIPYVVSGFYLGMLTEYSGLIVLRCINRHEVEEIDRKLRQTKLQIDNFIYRTAHDLRGPLATIQGLVNLLKMRKDNSEVDRFTDMIEVHGKKLDERLHQLMYLAKVDEPIQAPNFSLIVSELETALRKTIENNAFVDFLELIVTAQTPILHGYDEVQIRSMLTNILLYILTLPKCSTSSFIRINVIENFSDLKLTIKAEGFETDPDIRRSIHEIDPSTYTDLLQSSKFTYLFAAQKIALPLKALISVDHVGTDNEQFTISIPKPKTSPAFRKA
jgi:light-regulated signal transduction histidine kinase (bacteriophytochrome)